MAMPINFADVEEFQPLDPGTYVARISGGKVGKAGANAKHPGDPLINWEFTIIDEDYPEYEGRKVWMNLSLTKTALPMALRFYKRIGFTDEELKDPDFDVLDPETISDVVDRECRVVVTYDEANERNNVAKVLAYETESVLP